MYLSHRRRMDIKVFVSLPRLMSSNNYLFNITVDIFHSLYWQYHQCSLVNTIFNGLNFKIIASTTCACFLINGKHTTYTPIQVFLHCTPKLIKEFFSYFFVTYKVYKLKQETICHFYRQAELVANSAAIFVANFVTNINKSSAFSNTCLLNISSQNACCGKTPLTFITSLKSHFSVGTNFLKNKTECLP